MGIPLASLLGEIRAGWEKSRSIALCFGDLLGGSLLRWRRAETEWDTPPCDGAFMVATAVQLTVKEEPVSSRPGQRHNKLGHRRDVPAIGHPPKTTPVEIERITKNATAHAEALDPIVSTMPSGNARSGGAGWSLRPRSSKSRSVHSSGAGPGP